MPVMEPARSKKAWIIGGVLVVLAIVSFAMFNRADNVETPGIAAGDQNMLVVNDQDPDAVAVLVDTASVREPAFIVIHEDNNGRPGTMAGTSRLLTPGMHRNVTVIMQLKPGAMYHAMFHADDGNGLFDHMTDTRHLMDNAGREVVKMFRVRLSSSADDIKG